MMSLQEEEGERKRKKNDKEKIWAVDDSGTRT